jgi:hypothetical protein
MSTTADDSSIVLDSASVLDVARAVVGRPAADLGEWRVEPLKGMGFGASIHRVAGTARDESGPVPWSVIRKYVRDTGGDANEIRYWKREPLAYSSGVLEQLPAINVPRCLQQDEDASGIVLWLEDVHGAERPWTIPRFETVARDLGRLGGVYAVGRPLPREPWLSRQWLAGWVEQAATAFDEFSTAVSDPLLARMYPPEVAATMVELWESRTRIFNALSAAPQVLGHLDAVPANVIVRDGRTTLIDWAFVGHAALGEELAALVGGCTNFGDTPPSELPGVDAAAFPAYIHGPHDVGWDGDVDIVLFGYCVAAALRYCVAPTAFYVRGTNPDGSIADGIGIRDTDQRAFQEASFGRPFEELLETSVATSTFLAVGLGREALQLLAAQESNLRTKP